MESKQILNNRSAAEEGGFVDGCGAGLGIRFIHGSAMRQQNRDSVDRPMPDCVIQWTRAFGVANIEIGAVLDQALNHLQVTISYCVLQRRTPCCPFPVDVSASLDQFRSQAYVVK